MALCLLSHSQVRRLTIHSQYACAIDGDLRVLVPVRRYQLVLKHRLLDQLGGFSHLLLEALAQMPDRGIRWVLDITGLSPQQLAPIQGRLEGLGLIENGKLTPQSRALLTFKRLLHGQSRSLWLDGAYKTHSFCGAHTLQTVALDEQDFVIRQWHRGDGKPRRWPTADWNEDCERQKKRIMMCPDQYLSIAFEDFYSCFKDAKFIPTEWVLQVRLDAESAKSDQAIEVNLESQFVSRKQGCEFKFASPVICLSTRYSLPADAPDHLSQLLPPNQLRFTTFLDYDDECSDEIILSESPDTPWVWPIVDTIVREQVIEQLFYEVASSEDCVSSVINRKHVLEDRWQHLGFNWRAVEQSLNLEGLHVVSGDQ